LWIHDIALRISTTNLRILLCLSVTFKMPTKNNFFAYYFLNVHLHHYLKIKSHKEVTKYYNYYFCLMIERSGYGRSKNIWIYGSGSLTLEQMVNFVKCIVFVLTFAVFHQTVLAIQVPSCYAVGFPLILNPKNIHLIHSPRIRQL
jgi:hypothetical protein